MAARMTGLAKGGQIMATCATVMQLPKILRTATRKIAALSIKGKEDSVAVCEIIWQTNDDLTMANFLCCQVQLNLTFRGDTYFMNLLCPRIMMGRDLLQFRRLRQNQPRGNTLLSNCARKSFSSPTKAPMATLCTRTVRRSWCCAAKK